MLLRWVDERTGLVAGVRKFFDEEIPASSGWHQVFGSVALFVLVSQFATGALLALNFAPQPGASHSSLQYIVSEIPGGRLIRGLHHWGASMMVVIVVLHMVQAAIWGAYKKPRELTWLIGILLLFLTLGFGLTGYLLPWDNRAYWATVVTIQISGLAPGGSIVQGLLGSPEGQVGVGVYQRFYALHVVILPAITMALAIFHVGLVRRHGVAPQPGDENKPSKRFWPEQAYKDTASIFAAFTLLFALAAFADVPLEQVANPLDLSYVPRPEWYFLFLFQLLKFFAGSMEVVGAVILPSVAALGLALVPFLDKGQVRRASQRAVAIGTVALCAITWGGLTAAAILTTPEQQPSQPDITVDPAGWNSFGPEVLAGLHHFRTLKCAECHNVVGGQPKAGPTLTAGRERRAPAWMAQHFQDPTAAGEEASLSDAQVRTLSALATTVDAANGTELAAAPILPVRGAQIYVSQGCSSCHVVNGAGQSVGPVLDGVGLRRSARWLEDHFRSPAEFSEGSVMPPLDLPQPEMDAIVAYMLSLTH